MYEYKVKKLIKIVDGDTLDLEIDLGFNITIQERIRLSGIDAPEIRSSDVVEREKANASRLWLEKKLKDRKMRILTEKDDKYGRMLGWVYIEEDPVPINTQLIKEGLALPYKK